MSVLGHGDWEALLIGLLVLVEARVEDLDEPRECVNLGRRLDDTAGPISDNRFMRRASFRS